MEVLRKALDDLSDLCDVVEEKFVEERDAFKGANPNGIAPR
jgi:DNA-directed RNA polymerase I and III subunit RPAC2